MDTEKNDSWETWEKGIVSEDGKRALLYNPSHLFGLEAAVSVMSTVGLINRNQDIQHNVDLHTRASRDWSAGEVLLITIITIMKLTGC